MPLITTICSVLIKELVAVLFPHLVGVCVEQVFRSGTTVRIRARTGTAEAACPACGTPSRRVHSHYERRLSDTAVGGQEVLIHLRVHRFFCRASTTAAAASGRRGRCRPSRWRWGAGPEPGSPAGWRPQ
ncbi:transposase family protein [Nonomuraea antimicrobica]|uniref:transposase family protein n=1 Tax=Nonomuraea antimicrobica TaxID=561173 RepID=UPI003CD08882